MPKMLHLVKYLKMHNMVEECTKLQYKIEIDTREYSPKEHQVVLLLEGTIQQTVLRQASLPFSTEDCSLVPNQYFVITSTHHLTPEPPVTPFCRVHGYFLPC